MPDSAKKKQTGFTLIELLIAMALALVIIGSLSSTFLSQRKTYDVQEQIMEMIQNGRAAMDVMTSEIMMTGYGVTSNDLPTWIDWVSGVTFDENPKIVDGTGALGTDIIHIAACFDAPEATLASNASVGDTTIDITPRSGTTTSDSFNTVDEKNICINGIERAVVTGVSGNTLTIDTDPSTAGNQGLSNAYDVSAVTVDICVVKVISYSIVQETDGSRTVYTLKRNENLGAGRQPLAENIIDLQINAVTNSDGDIIAVEINPLTAQTDKPDPNFSENNGYRTHDLRSFITPPNLNLD